MDELVSAQKRGVRVKVILDQNVDFDSPSNEGSGWEIQDKNDVLFSYLKKQGVEVCYDSMYLLTHAKAIVIDGELSILGSGVVELPSRA